jgi:hypothetical protein
VEAQKYFEDLNNTKQCPSWVGHNYLPYREETNDIDYTDNKSKFSSNKIIKYMHTNNHTCKLYLIPIRIPMILKNVEISKMLFLFHVMQVLLSVLFSRKEEDLMLYRIDQWPNHNHTWELFYIFIHHFDQIKIIRIQPVMSTSHPSHLYLIRNQQNFLFLQVL